MLSINNKDLSNSDKHLSDRDKAVSDVAYAQELIHRAFPARRYGKVEAALYEAYRFMKPRVEKRIEREFTMRRVRTLHEGKARRVDGAELEALKAAQFEEARREYRELNARLAQLDAELADMAAEMDRAAGDSVGGTVHRRGDVPARPGQAPEIVRRMDRA